MKNLWQLQTQVHQDRYVQNKKTMPEQIITCTDPIQAARDWVTFAKPGPRRTWTFTRWTVSVARRAIVRLKIPLTSCNHQDNDHNPGKKTGLQGTVAGGHTFTVRYDWDPNHGFHVNAMLDGNRKLYKPSTQNMQLNTELQARQRYDELTGKIDRLGDQDAAHWFMNPQVFSPW